MSTHNDHPLTQHELHQTIAGVATAAALYSYVERNQIQIKGLVFRWVLVLFGIPIAAFLCLAPLANNVEPDSKFGSPPEWISAAMMWIGGIEIVLIIVAYIHISGDWTKQAYQNAALRQQTTQQADVDKVRYDYAVAQVTGQAVADALRGQQPPESPTGAPQGPTAPPPGPPAPMGSTTPTLWVPTFQGPKRRELQRSETTLDGLWMKDFRGVDPDDL